MPRRSQDVDSVARDSGQAADSDGLQAADGVGKPPAKDLEEQRCDRAQREKEPDLAHVGPQLLQVEGQKRSPHVPGDIGQDHGSHEQLQAVGQQRSLVIIHAISPIRLLAGRAVWRKAPRSSLSNGQRAVVDIALL